ncbi:MAG: glutamine-hydrolyzing carbamoyl-phosphate synthase small subunit [Candidatus Polarisedimenticolia bacterium]
MGGKGRRASGKTPAGRLVLEGGTVFEGTVFGAARPVAGEVVFTTGMVGYPEALTDPSYRGQILVFTYPSIGNYGIPAPAPPPAKGGPAPLPDRPYESDRVQVAGVICASYSAEFSHHGAARSLGEWLTGQGVPALTGIDTRALTRRIRVHGALLGRIEIDGTPAPAFADPNARNLVAEVSTRQVERYGDPCGVPVVLIDCGRKNNQVRMLARMGAEVRVVPWDHDLPRGGKRDYAGVVLSNGPGDPRLAERTVKTARSLMRAGVPILGICLGHQILSLAAGARTYKMKFGHRAHNQPCVDAATGRCYQTSQNHGFAVDGATLPAGWNAWFTNANDGTNEGIRHATGPWRSVQFHPEAAPGPGGTEWILEEFLEGIR